MSHETISKLITAHYAKSGIKGDQYIKKLIQIPITIPEWNSSDVKNLIKNLSGRLDENYSKIVNENVDLIAAGVELNPREIKRFINNFIVSYEMYSFYGKIVDPKELLIVQSLKVRWNNFYRYFSSDEDFREEIKKYVGVLKNQRIVIFEEQKKVLPQKHADVLRDYVSDTELWNFIQAEQNVIFSIEDWERFRRAIESVRDISEKPAISPARNFGETYRDIWELINVGNFNKAIKYLDDALKANPNNADLLNQKGFALKGLNKTTEALACYEKAIQINPNHVFAWFNKAQLLGDLRQNDEALKCYDTAIEQYNNAIKLNPNSIFLMQGLEERIWGSKGYTLSIMGRYPEAIICNNKTVEINPNSVLAWYNKGLTHGNMRDYNEALGCFDRAIAIDKGYGPIWQTKAYTLFNLGRYSEAVKCYEKAIEITPNNPDLYDQKGTALQNLGMSEEGRAAHEMAVKLRKAHSN